MVWIIEVLVGAQPTLKEVASPFQHTKSLLEPGATVQIVPLDDGIEVYCDEEGLYKDLPFNRALVTRAPELPPGFDMSNVIGYEPDMALPGELGEHRIHGPFVLARHDLENDKPMSLTDEDVQRWAPNLTIPMG